MILVDATAGGTLIGKSIEAAKALLEGMTSNNYHWSSERASSKKSSDIYDVDTVDFLASKVDTLTQWFESLGVPNLGSSSGMSYEGGDV